MSLIDVSLENPQKERAILVGVCLTSGAAALERAETSLLELAELVEAAGGEVAASVMQRRDQLDKATLVGRGKVAEIKTAADDLRADLLVFDLELSGSQIRNLEQATGLRVIDRTLVILDIFARRASTREGQLQVELAQLKYRLSRLTGRGVALSRLGGGIGTRGPGESKLESDRRHIARRIHALTVALRDVRSRRERTRAQRARAHILSVAVVGYTNAGKSTLVNRLCDADLATMDQVFATLDPSARRLSADFGPPVVLIDTVGFIRNLPHHLVEAFQATLEEVTRCDIILQVTDLSDPEAQAQAGVVDQELERLGAAAKPRIHVLNKIDLLPSGQALPAAFQPRDNQRVLAVSAKTGQGIEALKTALTEIRTASQPQMTIRIPYTAAGLINHIHHYGTLVRQSEDATGIDLTFRLPASHLAPVLPYLENGAPVAPHTENE